MFRISGGGIRAGLVAVASLLVMTVMAACGNATIEGAGDGQTRNVTPVSSPAANLAGNTPGNATPGNPTNTPATGIRGTAGIGSSGSAPTAGNDQTLIQGTAGTGARNAGGGAGSGGGTGAGTGAIDQGTAVAGASNLNNATVVAPVSNSTPGNPATTTAAPAPYNTPVITTNASGLPLFAGAVPVNLSEEQKGQLIQGYDQLKQAIDQPKIDLYKVRGDTTSRPAMDFYQTQLEGTGWSNRSNQLNQLTQSPSGSYVNFLGNTPMLFTKDNQLFLVAVTAPLASDSARTPALAGQFQPGDIALMTISGSARVKIQ